MNKIGHQVELPFIEAERLAMDVLETPVRRPDSGILSPCVAMEGVWRLGSRDNSVIMLFRQETLRAQFEQIAMNSTDLDGFRIAIAPEDAVTDAEDSVAQSPMGRRLPGWEGRLFPDGTRSLEHGFNRALWIIAAVAMIAIIGLLATFALRRFVAQSRQTELRNDFLSTVSHELKTPLTSIRMLVDTLVAGEYRNPERTRQYLEIIARENERLSTLVETFLTYSRLESGRTVFQFHEVGPDEIAHQALDAMAGKYESASAKLDLNIASDIPLIIADDATLTTALINLLDNALKYTGNDKQISLRVTSDREMVRFAVTDNGVGLSATDREQVLERFFRADTSHSNSVSGTGLGLSIVSYIVDAHKGKVSIKSELGKGSTFAISIPSAAPRSRSISTPTS